MLLTMFAAAIIMGIIIGFVTARVASGDLSSASSVSISWNEMARRSQHSSGRWPTGYLPTWLGGLVGGIVGGLIGRQALSAYVDAFPRPGFDDLGVLLVGTPLAALVGAGLGVWGILRLLGYRRPAISAILFSLLLILFAPIIAGVGSVVLPVNIGIDAGYAVTGILSTLIAALTARSIATR